MSIVREPAVAGTFYPADHAALRAQVEAMLREAPRPARAAKAIIAPHAGYVYSGPVAASAFAALGDMRRVRRVVLVGPAHRVALRGVASPGADILSTPLGDVLVDRGSLDRAGVPEDERAHTEEHCLEVELPFLQIVAPDAHVIPLVAGPGSAGEVARVLDALWDGDDTRVVVSSDLSHYLPYDRAREVDRETAEAILALDADALSGERACGHAAVAGLLDVAKRRGLTAELLDLRSSGDTRGSRSEVVGYGAFGFYEGGA